MRNNIGLLLAKRALLSPQLDGLVEVERDRRFTFADLNAQANRTAAALAALGVGKGDRVALLLMNGVELGAVVVPRNWRLVADELAFILADSAHRPLRRRDPAESRREDAEAGAPRAVPRACARIGSREVAV